MPFGGDTYDPDRDRERLLAELHRVQDCLMRTAKATHCSITVERKGNRTSIRAIEAIQGRRCLMSRWFTLSRISGQTGDPEASVSARLRDHRKPKFGGMDWNLIEWGGWIMESKYVDKGLWKYRLTNVTSTMRVITRR